MPLLRQFAIAMFVFNTASSAQQPPIIDRELLFGEIEIGGAQLSPDGKYISFMKPLKGVRNVWVKKTGEPFAAARPMTAEPKRPLSGYFWTRDSRYILFTKDKDGDENFNVYAVDPAAAPDAATGVPPARDLTGVKGARVYIYSLPKSQPDTVFLGLNDRDKAWHDLYKLSLSTGEKTLLRKNTDRVSGWVFDNAGNLRMAERSAENGDTELLRVDADKFTKIYSCSVLETCSVERFDKDNRRVYIITNQGDSRDLVELALLDPATGKTEKVESDPANRVDFLGALFSDKTDELVATVYMDEKQKIYFKNKEFEADYRWLQSKLPGYEISHGSRTADESLFLVTAYSDREPGEVYLFDRKYKKLELQYKNREKIPRDSLSEMKPIRFESSDGLEIPAYLTLPKGLEAKNLPLMVVPHGGPWARDGWGPNGLAQFLANRGYAVLQPNFRGSTGYGKKFINKGNGEWGRKMQDDLTWGAKYLEQKGIADPKRVGIMGGSYGGYATLAGVAFTPDVYAAAVSIVGPANQMTLLDSIPAYWEAGRKTLYARMADPGTPEGKKRLMEMSPLFSANKIKTPLMVMQGANDPRVNKAESDQIVVALRDRGFPVEYIVAPDEGHGFLRPVNMMASMAAAETFLAKHLGGRAQEGGTPEVMTRLKEITVDPKTVTLAKKVDAAAVTVPKIAARPKPATDHYASKIEVGTQSIPIEISSEVREDGGRIVFADTMKSPMGEAKDTVWLDPETLTLLKRTVSQGPASIEIEYKDGKVTGSMKMNGQDKPISADTGGPLFADGAGQQYSIAALPLAEGYAATFRNFDVQSAKTKLYEAKVTATEPVTVPAGAYNAFKVEIASADGGAGKITIWVDKDTRKPVKIQAIMPQMGGAKLTSELTK